MHKTDNSRKVFRGALTRALAVILCVSMVFGVLGLTGCSLIDDLTNGVAQKSLSEAELARLVTNAVISDADVADCYAKFPKNQLDGLSYSMFSEYCSILRKNSAEHGTPDSFRILNDEDKQEYFASIDSGDMEGFQSIYKYGDMDVIELCYSKDKDPSAPPVRFMLYNNGSVCTLPSDFIVDSMLAYSYINHYFEMIDDGNVDGLEAVIKSTYNSDIYLNSVIHAKAEYISEYYRLKVKTSTSDYEIKLFSPTHITYVIPEVFSSDGTKIVSKTVELRLKSDGNFLVEDDIPATIRELRLSKEGSGRLRMGSTYTSSEIKYLLGDPIVATYTTDQVILAYNGMTIRLDAEIENGQWTSGRLTSVVFRKQSVFSLSDDLYIGMNVAELLLVYPMFDECGYTGSFKNGDGEFTLSFEFDEYGNVSIIKLGEDLS